MSKKELKELIYDLEDILKLDKRFKNNGENKYKKMIKNMYINSNRYSLINLTYLNPPRPIEIKTTPIIQNECKSVEIKTTPIIQNECKPVEIKNTLAEQNTCSNDYDFLVKMDHSLDELNKLAKL